MGMITNCAHFEVPSAFFVGDPPPPTPPSTAAAVKMPNSFCLIFLSFEHVHMTSPVNCFCEYSFLSETCSCSQSLSAPSLGK